MPIINPIEKSVSTTLDKTSADTKLSLDKKNILEFNVNIQGFSSKSVNKPPKVRVLLEQKDMRFCVDATKVGKMYSVVIPKMKNIMEAGSCDAHMEIIIDNKFFVPWESQIEFDKEVQTPAAPIVEEIQKPPTPVAPKPVAPVPIIEEVQDYAEPIIEEIQEVPAPIEMKPRRPKKIIDSINTKNENNKVENKVKMGVFDKTFADIMEQDRITDELMNNLFKGNKEKRISKLESRKTRPVIRKKVRLQDVIVKEEKMRSKSKKEKGVKLVVDMKSKRSIKKENVNVDNIVDDLYSLAKKIH